MGAEVRTFTLRAAVAGIGVLTIICLADAVPEANAEGPECVADAAVQCAQQAQALRPDPHAGKHLTISCSPARLGAHCMKQWVP
jgi:hypothetical protein